MEAAMCTVKEGCTMARAGTEHGVPKSTRIKGRVLHGTKPGPVPY